MKRPEINVKKLFSQNAQASAEEKDKIAKLIKISPEILELFEKTYKEKALEEEEELDNFFKINAKKMKKILDKNQEETIEVPEDIQERIIAELKEQSLVYIYDGEQSTEKPQLRLGEGFKEVTSNEISQIPKDIRPQLTGNLMSVDITEPSYITVFGFLNKYQETGNKMFYHLFRQGLDILDLDPIVYETIGLNPNSMGYWLPAIAEANKEKGFFKIPKTKILKVPMSLLQLTRKPYGELTKTTTNILNKYIYEVFDLDDTKDYFVKTGTYASKFDFRNAKVTKGQEVHELGQYLLFIHYQALQMASPLSKPTIYGASTTNEWVVREFIDDKENNPSIYMGLPLHTEYRVFVDFDTNEVLSVANYWDEDTLLKRFGFEKDRNDPHKIHDYITYKSHRDTIYERFETNKALVEEKIKEVIKDCSLKGQWSIDVMQNGNDYWFIDMGKAEESTFYNTVPKEKRKPLTTTWIPALQEPTNQ